jgi:hypothetical protein
VSPPAGLRAVALPELEQLLAEVRRGAVSCPLTPAGLLSAHLGHLEPHLALLRGLDAGGVQAVLDAVIAERAARSTPRVELVWTGPETRVSTARDTAVVVRELFAAAERTVLIAGFSFDHGTDIFGPLHEGMRDRGVSAALFLDIPRAGRDEQDLEAHADRQVERFLRNNWAFGAPVPDIHYDPRTVQPDALASLHAKCVVVDDRRALVTSANFTERGQARNIEVGVLVEEERLARALAGQWWRLVEAGLLRRWRGRSS